MARKTACGTPKQFCTGTMTKTNKSLGGGMMTHTTPEEAFACYAQFLVKTGYTKVGSRDFAPPDGGPVVVLTKKCRFGAPLRTGKSVKGQSASVFVPYSGKRCKSGTIVG